MHRIKRIFSNLPIILSTAILIYLIVIPVILLLVAGFKDHGLVMKPGFMLDNYIGLYTSRRTYTLMLNTVKFAAGSMLMTLILSVALAWLVQKTNIPFKPWLRAAIIVPMAIPGMLIAMGWALLASPKIGILNTFLMDVFSLEQPFLNIYSLTGMIFVQGLFGVPSSFLMLSVCFNNMDPVFEEASATSGAGTLKTLRRIILPILTPGLLAVAIASFLIGLATFDVAGVLGKPARINVLSTDIMDSLYEASGMPDFGRISALATVFLVCILVLSYIYNQQTMAIHRFASITGKGYRPKEMDLGRGKPFAVAFIILYLLLAVLLPIASLGWQSLTPYYGKITLDNLDLLSLNNYAALLDYPKLGGAIINTLIIAAVSATAVTVLATVVSWIIVRSKYKARRVLDYLSMLPMAVPPIMMGVALITLYLALKVGIYGTIWIIAIAYTTIFMSYSTRTANNTLFQITNDLEEAAQVSGASWMRTMRTIILPLLRPALIGLWIWVLIHAVRELTAAMMLQSPRNYVLTTILWGLWEHGDSPMMAALGVCLAVFLFLVMGIGQVLAKRFQIPTGFE
ncbi:MAG: iron ABC transporter permease [Chloroflexota bacterium]